MRVLFLTHSYPRSAEDAPGSFLLRLAVALRGEGVDVEVVSPAAAGLESHDTIEGIPTEHFRYAPRRYETLAYTGTMTDQVRESWSARMSLVGFVGAEFAHAVQARRRFAPAVVHAHWWFPSGLVGSWVHRLVGVPFVTTLHGTDVRLARDSAILRPAFRQVLRTSTVVTAVSRWLAGEAGSIVSGVATPTVAPMPVDTSLFTPGGARRPDRLLYVGRLNRQKGIEHLLRAIPSLNTNATLDVVGSGDATSESALRRLSEELSVADRVVWHGAVRQGALPEFYRRSTAVVIPSIDEGLGLVAAEAQLCGAPVVASDSGGLPDIVRDGMTGVLVPPADPRALARALSDLLCDPQRAASLGAAGRMHALAEFAPESAARRYAQVYRTAISSSET